MAPEEAVNKLESVLDYFDNTATTLTDPGSDTSMEKLQDMVVELKEDVLDAEYAIGEVVDLLPGKFEEARKELDDARQELSLASMEADELPANLNVEDARVLISDLNSALSGAVMDMEDVLARLKDGEE